MLNCREVTRLVASDQLQTAGWRTRLAVRMHLFMCHHCRRYVEQLRAIGRAARRLADGGAEDDVAVRRVLDRVARPDGWSAPPPEP